ncbi:MAG: YjjG family noncanonical pyrimidine nucleotidase [Pseudolactococcus laudensis]
MRYRVIIFDLDDTVLDFKAGEKKRLETVFKHFDTVGVNYEAWVVAYTDVNKRIWQAIEKGAEPQPLLNQRFSETFAVFNQDIDGVAAEAIYRQVLDANDAIITGADKVLETLHQKGYKLVVGTNGKTATQYQRLKFTGFHRYFEHVVISQEIGHAKPSQAFFEHILALYPEQPKSVFLMVGDTLATDILGANQADIASVWLEQSKQQRLARAYEPTYSIASLSELPFVLAN